MKKERSTFEMNKEEIKYHLINSGLAGSLVLLGSFVSGNFSLSGILVAVITSLIVAATKFKEYWTTQEAEYKKTLMNFL